MGGMSNSTNSTVSDSVKGWIDRYRDAQQAATQAIPTDAVARLIERFRIALAEDRQVFVFGNGGSASNASHFATDLGKGSSDKLGKRFRVISLNDNVSWMTALGNDYAYEDVYVRQLMNYARPGDIVLTMSVSGSSPNLVKAVQWAKSNGVWTAGLVGGKRGKLADLCDLPIVVPTEHYGRAEDAQMTICHMLCYAFIENPRWGQ
jgi:D-sedoheptulose 7-phosphate isomerase